MSNLTRFDPLGDIFRSFFLRPLDLGTNSANTPSIRMDLAENPDAFLERTQQKRVAAASKRLSIE